MVYTIHLWWFGGWFIIVLTHYCIFSGGNPLLPPLSAIVSALGSCGNVGTKISVATALTISRWTMTRNAGNGWERDVGTATPSDLRTLRTSCLCLGNLREFWVIFFAAQNFLWGISKHFPRIVNRRIWGRVQHGAAQPAGASSWRTTFKELILLMDSHWKLQYDLKSRHAFAKLFVSTV